MYLIEEDVDTRHWKALVRYYMGEALALQQELLVVGALDYAPDAFVKTGAHTHARACVVPRVCMWIW